MGYEEQAGQLVWGGDGKKAAVGVTKNLNRVEVGKKSKGSSFCLVLCCSVLLFLLAVAYYLLGGEDVFGDDEEGIGEYEYFRLEYEYDNNEYEASAPVEYEYENNEYETSGPVEYEYETSAPVEYEYETSDPVEYEYDTSDPPVEYEGGIESICENVPTGIAVQANPSDYISVLFVEEPPLEDCVAFLEAAERLSNAVSQTSNNLGFTPDEDFTLLDMCGVETDSNPAVFPAGVLIENLVIAAVLEEIDGVGNTLAAAGPCIYNTQTQLPLLGIMYFDTADTESIAQNGKLNDVVLHEMMHVLGFGVAWNPLLSSTGEEITSFDILEDPVFSSDGSGNLVVNVDNEPKYTGAEGVAEFEILTGESETFLPIQGVQVNGVDVFDAESGEGTGSIDSHIDKDTFQDALMTFAIDLEGGESPLSSMGLSMLRDIGYIVDTSGADPYSLISVQSKGGSSLRGSKSGTIDLKGDVLDLKPKMLDIDSSGELNFERSNSGRRINELIRKQ
eukprot:maker-scaffold_6-snap-gene-6.8-mRNA-1 protein AED:0.01 eAED:0.01 QI:59/0.5/0.33/1/0.5/0.33/3/66/503